MTTELIRKTIVYSIATALLIVSFVLPPMGIIDPSVMASAGIMIGGYEWLFGHSVKSVNIDKTGVHIETFEKIK